MFIVDPASSEVARSTMHELAYPPFVGTAQRALASSDCKCRYARGCEKEMVEAVFRRQFT